MPLDLFGNITFDSESTSVINKLYGTLKPGFSMADGSKFEDRLVKIINNAAVIGLEAAKSKVPIRTGELRNQHMYIDYAQSGKYSAHVLVDDNAHDSFGKSGSAPASQLATWLSTKKGNRHLDSDAFSEIKYGNFSSISAGSPTRNWIKSAQTAFSNTISNNITRL